MTAQPARTAQLWLVRPPRRLDPGEPHRCLDCGRYDEHGTFGPPGSDTITLSDGQEHAVYLPDQWLCSRHSAARWRAHLAITPAMVERRRRRLRAFRQAKAEGYRGDELFSVAEARLRRAS